MSSFVKGLMEANTVGLKESVRFTRSCGVLLLEYINHYKSTIGVDLPEYREESFFSALQWMRNAINKRWAIEDEFIYIKVRLTKPVARELRYFMINFKYEEETYPDLKNAFAWINNQINKKYSVFDLVE